MENNMHLTNDEQLKAMWQDTNRRLEKIESQLEAEGRRVSSSNIKTTQQKLAWRYKRFMIIGAVAAVLLPGMLVMPDYMDVPDYTWHIVSAILFFVYFLTATCVDGYLHNALLNIRLGSTPTERVTGEVLRLKKIHHRSMMFLIPMAVITLCWFFSPFLHDRSVMIGGLCGLVIGLIVGIRVYLRMMAEYREILNQYS